MLLISLLRPLAHRPLLFRLSCAAPSPSSISRFQLTIRFGLPDAETRREVFGVYAKQLSQKDLEFLASVSKGMSCRDIKVSEAFV